MVRLHQSVCRYQDTSLWPVVVVQRSERGTVTAQTRVRLPERTDVTHGSKPAKGSTIMRRWRLWRGSLPSSGLIWSKQGMSAVHFVPNAFPHSAFCPPPRNSRLPPSISNFRSSTFCNLQLSAEHPPLSLHLSDFPSFHPCPQFYDPTHHPIPAQSTQKHDHEAANVHDRFTLAQLQVTPTS